MPVIILSNLKGGVAKTTSAVAIAECLASRGKRTLLIDADHQCMSGELLLGEGRQLRCENTRRTLHDLLAAMLDEEFSPDRFGAFVADRASNIGGGLETLSVLPCSIRVDDFSTNMAKARRGHGSNEEFLRVLNRRRAQLKRWLAGEYEYVIVDCPPSIALQVQVLMPVADCYVVPSIPDRLSVRGSLYLLDRIRAKGYATQPLGTLWTLYRSAVTLHNRIIKAVRSGRPPYDRLPKPFETIIPNAAAIANATEPGQAPKTFAQKYGFPFAGYFEALCDEMMARLRVLPGDATVRAAAEAAPTAV
ncbi:MAG TPA: AAA family ATPase [Tepidisphaeraceae bacterium]|nr:AAA family ATPase [Tepidisphaeraceae bacterium]